MNDAPDKVTTNRNLLLDAQKRGPLSTLGAFFRLSGPGWLQSAITLGGGSLAGALFLGVLGGSSLLWLQLVAIIMGVIMLSAISYVTLSTGERPFQSINTHINPVLGWGWIIATCMANIIWCMPQFGLSFEALQKNLLVGHLSDSDSSKMWTSFVLLAIALAIVLMNSRRGLMAKIFDYFLKAMVATAVLSFFGVVVYLSIKGELRWGEILAGFVPDLRQWNKPTGKLMEVLQQAPSGYREFWHEQIVSQQRNVMIGAAATAVGINMTFLLPYSMLHRGWDRPFRGLARFDLMTGMAIPYLLATSCVVIAAASAFHATADEKFLSSNPSEIVASPIYGGAQKVLEKRLKKEHGEKVFEGLDEEAKKQRVAELAVALSPEERILASGLVKRNAFQLSQSLAPLLTEGGARWIFGIGVFAMGFSTIIILMLINGFAVCEMFNKPEDKTLFAVGCLISGVAGAMWWQVWSGDSRFWLTILASIFGMMLLPIAYVTFFMMMNSKRLMGKEKPTGTSMAVWNALMFVAVAGAIVAAGSAIFTRIQDKDNPLAGRIVIGIAAVYGVLVVIGFFLTPKSSDLNSE